MSSSRKGELIETYVLRDIFPPSKQQLMKLPTVPDSFLSLCLLTPGVISQKRFFFPRVHTVAWVFPCSKHQTRILNPETPLNSSLRAIKVYVFRMQATIFPSLSFRAVHLTIHCRCAPTFLNCIKVFDGFRDSRINARSCLVSPSSPCFLHLESVFFRFFFRRDFPPFCPF